MTKDERRFLHLIAETPGLPASSLPRAKRGSTIKALELAGLIHYGPGGWYVTPRAAHDVATTLSHLPLKQGDLVECARCGARGIASDLTGNVHTKACEVML